MPLPLAGCTNVGIDSLATNPRFDVSAVPFSMFGSKMAISRLRAGQPNLGPGEPEGLYLRYVHDGRSFNLFRIEVWEGSRRLDPDIEADCAKLTLRPRNPVEGQGDARRVEFCFQAADVIRVRGFGLSVRLVRDPNAYGGAVVGPGPRSRVIVDKIPSKFLLMPSIGSLEVDAPWKVVEGFGTLIQICPKVVASFGPEAGGRLEFAVASYESEPGEVSLADDFDDCVATRAGQFSGWLNDRMTVAARYPVQRDLAEYIRWSAVVPAEGNYQSPAMLMSKNWMVHLWNWDNYFNAWASAHAHPDFAWNQFMLFFRHQHETGALADHIDQQDVSFVYTKPPIHGWILAHLLELLGPIDADRRSTLYESLKEWTRWWLRYRDDDGDGICQYNHGNDSGWDNATVFDVGQPVESPDLSAYLIVQMDVLSRLARDMGKSDEASRWAGEADRTLMRLLKHSWRGDRFVAPRSGDHAIASDADSLILLLPIVLGKRLPRAIRKAIVARLRDGAGFLTPHGLATENVGSPNYLPFGYWRGPIWAPSTLIVVDGLTQIAEHGLAREVADRFCEMCRANGFAENFDALTGAARCDPAYTWTPSVFTILAQEYLA
jgi:hypothetical protein